MMIDDANIDHLRTPARKHLAPDAHPEGKRALLARFETLASMLDTVGATPVIPVPDPERWPLSLTERGCLVASRLPVGEQQAVQLPSLLEVAYTANKLEVRACLSWDLARADHAAIITKAKLTIAVVRPFARVVWRIADEDEAKFVRYFAARCPAIVPTPQEFLRKVRLAISAHQQVQTRKQQRAAGELSAIKSSQQG
jgi:hypothetical protein